MLEATSEHVYEMREIVAKVRSIARYIKNSPKAKEKVGSYLEQQNRVLMVPLDVRTRWNSTYDRVAKFIKLKGAIQ